MAGERSVEERPGPGGGPPVVVEVGVVAAPGTAGALAEDLVRDVERELTAHFPGVCWRLHLVADGLVQPPAGDAELVTAARDVLLARGWDLVLCLTDLPLRVARRPVVAHASPLHGVAVLSVPALGTVGVRRRARDTALRLIGALLGESGDEADWSVDADRLRRMDRRLRELATDTDDAETVRFTARVLTGNLRLLIGMVRANRPWRLAARLSRALVAAGATGVFALVTSDIWRLADAFGWWRLSLVGLVAVGVTTATLVVGGGLWERARSPAVREQVTLFNLATTGTVLIGVLVLYATLFALALLTALVLVVPDLYADALGHPARFSDYAELAWLTSSLATLGGALGAGLEQDDVVREAAYTYRTSRDAERGADAA